MQDGGDVHKVLRSFKLRLFIYLDMTHVSISFNTGKLKPTISNIQIKWLLKKQHIQVDEALGLPIPDPKYSEPVWLVAPICCVASLFYINILLGEKPTRDMAQHEKALEKAFYEPAFEIKLF